LARAAQPLAADLHRRAARLHRLLDDMEDALVRRRAGFSAADVVAAKRAARRLAHLAAHQRRALRRLSRTAPGGPRSSLALRMADRAEGEARAAEQAAARLLDAWFAAESVRRGEIVKALTLMTTILVPSSLMAALYGMNFRHLPMAEHPWGFWIVLSVMGGAMAGLIWVFRRRRWL
jgi:magnesium transporter